MTVVDRLRRPAYTGPNRCWPCTVVNAILLGGAMVVVSIQSVPAALIAGLVGGMAIWLRGYLVPLTPRFAPRLVELLPGEFSKARPEERGSIGDVGGIDGDELIGQLVEAGVLAVEDDQLLLDAGFETEWEREQSRLRELSPDELATELSAALPSDREVDPVGAGGEWFDLGDGTWLSRPVTIAEVAAVATLEDVDGVSTAAGRAAAAPLRGFLGACPACEAALVETSPEQCCGGGNPRAGPDAVLACPDCDNQLFAFE